MLCHSRGTFLFQVMPDVFPEKFLTNTEIELWELHYAEFNKRTAGGKK